MKQITPALRAHIASTTSTLTTCWRITRADGQRHFYTEHDTDIVYLGNTYKSTGGFNKSAMKTSSSFATDTLEVNGFLSDDTIEDIEIRNGAFDYAEVEIFMINWQNPTMGELRLHYGFFGEVRTSPSGVFLIELRSLIDLLSNKVGEVYTPECRADFGDHRCKMVVEPPLWEAGKEYKEGDRVLVSFAETIKESVRIGPVNGSFEDGETGWTITSASVTKGDINASAYDGEYFVRQTSALTGTFEPTMRQTMNLVQGHVTAPDLSSGNMIFRINMYANSIEFGNKFAVNLQWYAGLNGTGGNAGSRTLDFGAQRPERNWIFREMSCPIPVNARSVRVRLNPYDFATNSKYDIGFDLVNCYVDYPNDKQELRDYRTYGGVEYEAMNDGTSSLTRPDWNPTHGSDTVDGTITWHATGGRRKMLATVTSDSTVPNRFRCSGLADADKSYVYGVVHVLSGMNAGMAVEVVDYIGATREVVTALPFPFPMMTGDVFSIQEGCSKTRLQCSQFENILNFRGEPDLPGNGRYFAVAGLKR